MCKVLYVSPLASHTRFTSTNAQALLSCTYPAKYLQIRHPNVYGHLYLRGIRIDVALKHNVRIEDIQRSLTTSST